MKKFQNLTCKEELIIRDALIAYLDKQNSLYEQILKTYNSEYSKSLNPNVKADLKESLENLQENIKAIKKLID